MNIIRSIEPELISCDDCVCMKYVNEIKLTIFQFCYAPKAPDNTHNIMFNPVRQLLRKRNRRERERGGGRVRLCSATARRTQ